MPLPSQFDYLQRIDRLEQDMADLQRRLVAPATVCCPDCAALPAAVDKGDGMLLVHCGVCGPDKSVTLTMRKDTPQPWQHYWNQAVSDELRTRVEAKT